MKKMAFFVEGQTEQIFINRLLLEIAGQNRTCREVLYKKEKECGKNH